MNTNQTIRMLAVLLMVLPVAFAACVKDECRQTRTFTYYTPVYKTKAEVYANIKSNAPRAIERPGKIYIKGGYIFLNEIDRGIHVIDNTNPLAPKNVAFIDIPGNIDIAAKGNTLYADMYVDLVAIDITQPKQVSVKKSIEGVFPYRAWGGGFVNTPNDPRIVVDWERHDTTYKETCDGYRGGIAFDNTVWTLSSGSAQMNGAASSPYGTGGSMARFTIMNDRLYAVSTNDLDVFNITTSNDPVRGNKVTVGWGIETIYPFKNRLFIGSQTGMFIFDVSNPDAPAPLGTFTHAMNCDPVVADDNYAYVTLRTGTTCRGATMNQLDVVNIQNLTSPSLVKSYPLSNPHGLSKDGNLLFICDGKAGVKVFNASNVQNLQLVKSIDNIHAYDVIAMNGIALVVGDDGLYQYNYTNSSNIMQVSKIPVNRK